MTEWHGLLARYLDRPDQTECENAFKAWLHGQIDGYFYSRREVEGHQLRSGEKVIADFVCVARPWMVQRGFTSAPFVIEAKYPLGWDKGAGKKMLAWAGQMIRYRHSKFYSRRTREFTILPAFVLSAPPLSECDHGLGESLKLLHHAGVGEMTIRPRKPYDPPEDCIGNPDYETVFGIQMSAGSSYWSNTRGRTKANLGSGVLDLKTWIEEEKRLAESRLLLRGHGPGQPGLEEQAALGDGREVVSAAESA